jgi:hypothetical protein
MSAAIDKETPGAADLKAPWHRLQYRLSRAPKALVGAWQKWPCAPMALCDFGAGVLDTRYCRNARQRRATKRMTRTPEEMTYIETYIRKSNV